MTGRAYLDWNATAPLRPEAREAMLRALDAANPSSVHAEGREARAIVERARAQVAALAGCEPGEVIFTSGATEANNLALSMAAVVHYAATDHASVVEAALSRPCDVALPARRDGTLERPEGGVVRGDYGPDVDAWLLGRRCIAVAAAQSETGVAEDVGDIYRSAAVRGLNAHCDATQAVGRIAFSFTLCGAATAALSAHKLGGPKGVGAMILRDDRLGDFRLFDWTPGGGQEQRRRAGTENVPGIAGFGAAAEAALRDLASGVWERVENLRDMMEARLKDAAPDLILIGEGARRLPNTSCVAVPGWKGETQVMQMDLAGFAISAGSACASGKVGPSRALKAMGFDDATAGSAIRVSLGPTTTEGEVMRFADAWTDRYRRFHRKSA